MKEKLNEVKRLANRRSFIKKGFAAAGTATITLLVRLPLYEPSDSRRDPGVQYLMIESF